MHPFQLSAEDLKLIKDRFAEQKELAKGRSKALFSIFDLDLDIEERVALEFIYAFMPLVDLADYSGDLFLKHVRHSLKALRETPWGGKITGQLFLHYVLPYRISNETIEDYRPYFWSELFGRVKHLSMAEAILETNHWCHEKATYIASDPRTSSPLTLVRTARGRCGEESALLVAALRSLGIPARQVYTPRWAHTDSNHAWVEAWADGEWYFLGACEPEPRLNMGWFDGPSRRAMLIHTRVPGTIYAGPEEKVQVKDGYTELNLLANYAPTQSLTVQVLGLDGRAVSQASVEFQVFNYGGFSPLTRLMTDDEGKAFLTAGHGDLMIHAFKDGFWGSILAKGNGPRIVDVVLGTGTENFAEYVFHVPPEQTQEDLGVSFVEREENNRRLKVEDHMRAAYEATFVSQEQAEKLASELALDPSTVWSVLERARGNSHELVDFLRRAVPEFGFLALELASILGAKDLTDTTSTILLDHLQGALPYAESYTKGQFRQFVLQPRIALEVLRPYRRFFQGEFSQAQQEAFRRDPEMLRAWIEEQITPVDDGRVRGWPTPRGVYELRAGDVLAKQILFVAMARSFGVAARLSPIDGTLENQSAGDQSHGKAILEFHKPRDRQIKIDYYQHFSLARLEGGVFRTLRFKGLDEEAFDEELFSHKLQVNPGLYRLTTGNRLSDGTALVTLRHFSVGAGEMRRVELVFAREPREAQILGQLPPGLIFRDYDNGSLVVVDNLRNHRGVVLAWIDPDREPTKHLIRELGERKAQFDAANISVVLCLGPDKITHSFKVAKYQGLPGKTHLVQDDSYQVLDQVQNALQEKIPQNFPIVVVADEEGVIRYTSSGYQIGTGAYILDCLEKGVY